MMKHLLNVLVTTLFLADFGNSYLVSGEDVDFVVENEHIEHHAHVHNDEEKEVNNGRESIDDEEEEPLVDDFSNTTIPDGFEANEEEEEEADIVQTDPPVKTDPPAETEPPTQRPKLGKWEVVAVGAEGSSSEDKLPFGITYDVDPLVGEVYFEAHEDRFNDVAEGRDQLLYVDLFAGVPSGGRCGDGTLLTGDSSTTIITSIEPYDEYSEVHPPSEGNNMQSFPVSRNGRVGKAIYKIEPNAFDLSGPQKIFFGDELKYCVRVSSKLDTGNGEMEYIGLADTNMRVHVKFIGTFAVATVAESSTHVVS